MCYFWVENLSNLCKLIVCGSQTLRNTQQTQTILDKIKWDTLPFGREKAVLLPCPLFNVAVMLSRTLTHMLTYNIDLGDGGRAEGKWPNRTDKVLQVNS